VPERVAVTAPVQAGRIGRRSFTSLLFSLRFIVVVIAMAGLSIGVGRSAVPAEQIAAATFELPHRPHAVDKKRKLKKQRPKAVAVDPAR